MKNKELKRRVNIMFAALQSKGFFARQNLLIGDTDGWSVVPDGCENVVFYNGQSYDSTFKYGYDSVLWLAWG